MAEINGTINFGTPPYSIVVRKVGETTGNRCTGSCNSFPVTFTEDSGDNQYYFIITDSQGCSKNSMELSGGVSNINCDVVQPSYNAELIQPVCTSGVWSNAVLKLTNIVGGYRYKICYNTLSMNCAPCADSDGFITGSSLDITLDTPQQSGNRGVLLRVYADSSCTNYKEYFDTMVNQPCPTENVPDFAAALVQPYCSQPSGGNIVNAVLKLSSVINATRYKICYNSSTFNCNCADSDGTISGNSIDITIPSPSEGVVQTNTIRVMNGTGCTLYKDYQFTISSPKCSSNQINIMVLDALFAKGSSTCSGNPVPRNVDFDMYFTPNTVGMSENGQKSLNKATLEKNIPNGNDVPNIYVASSLELNCNVGTGFYRWFFNLSLLRAKYPSINVFTFDLYIKRSLGSTNPVITPRITKQQNVALIKVSSPQTTNCDGSPAPATIVNNTDVGRVPCYNGDSDDDTTFSYGPTDVGYKKVGSLSFNITTNNYTWNTL